MKTALWWGRFDPEYSRNRILQQAFDALGWRVQMFHPLQSALGAFEARLRCLPTPNLVFVPCFRQRDIAAARRFSRTRGVPLLVDPLISAYDKQVFERGKFAEHSSRARHLLRWEQGLLQSADGVLADTTEHARFFHDVLGAPESRLNVVPVGAEEALFKPAAHAPNDPLVVLFFGSFLALQAPQVIIEAARRYHGPRVRWRLIGAGPMLAKCKALAAGLDNVEFSDWLPYAQLPAAIQHADIVLGVFGTTPKAGRVIPNKVYQALACGKPLITRRANAYPAELASATNSGIAWVEAGDAAALAQAVRRLAEHCEQLAEIGAQARAYYKKYFSSARVIMALNEALDRLAHGA